jgi:hypothetical protein
MTPRGMALTGRRAGIEVSDRGPIPASVVAQREAATWGT